MIAKRPSQPVFEWLFRNRLHYERKERKDMDANLKKDLQKLAIQIRMGVVEEIKARGFGHLGGSLTCWV